MFIDEGHFFPDISWIADKWAWLGHVVVVTGLIATHEREMFDSMA